MPIKQQEQEDHPKLQGELLVGFMANKRMTQRQMTDALNELGHKYTEGQVSKWVHNHVALRPESICAVREVLGLSGEETLALLYGAAMVEYLKHD